MTPIRVATITFDWYPFDVLVRRVAEAAIDGGAEVDVICLRQPHEQSFEIINGVRAFRLPMDRGFGRSLPRTLLDWSVFLLQAGVKVAQLHRQCPYDIVHVHNMPDYLVFAALLPKLAGAKVILEVQDTCPELMAAKAKSNVKPVVTWLARLQERLSTAFADHVITVGPPFERLLLQRGVPPEKMTIILNSADPKIFPEALQQHPRPRASDDEPFILMYHGTISERNGLDIAIRAVAIARHAVPTLRLDIQGRGEHLPYLQELARKLDVADRVVFTDSSPSEELVHFVVHGDIGIIPYRSDGFMDLVLPTKAYEFAWMRRPIIASDTPAIRSMFRPESIKFCRPEHPQEFADAIISLYEHPEERARMVANAAEDYLPYQWEKMAQRYQHLLSALAENPLPEKRPLSIAR
ncbi:glycosyltransferase involved in cell wall biosynthesis [Thermosporothrix hazakensis]|jgi:glycosyltransferase involved in cell wall biosynthesis|uniref:Glycosyltransferase involved in cell wall biosynthesis n=2 Tax=Thermosporothrix TaxID=768650 RepID=A0A326UDP6_THEHA|nr:glycosyltransferase family 4 protein [Thermosporothrix hazakensis]PZW35961.1 glycosyltransferase involved in cell wall biosynthesis [Thermosporothrix hazakensis]BBH88430.1 glycosyltransferase WbuB [Thermosporothrix sp. COM3]GCE46616.1 glycosyltransferase WbuB [Thermosporothrix hazakensis]